MDLPVVDVDLPEVDVDFLLRRLQMWIEYGIDPINPIDPMVHCMIPMVHCMIPWCIS